MAGIADTFASYFNIGVDLALTFPRAMFSGGTSMVYFPRSYDSVPDYRRWLEYVAPITYETSQGLQQCYLDANPDQDPGKLWLLFGGNGSLALDWFPVTSFAPASDRGFILFEYPGYGDCAGQPSPESIRESVDCLWQLLRRRFGLAPTSISVMGHSLGAAIAMDTAARYGLREPVLICPFTSLQAMAKRVAGGFWAGLLAHEYDNVAAIESWQRANGNAGGEIHLVHPLFDEIVPFSMGQSLAERFPGAVDMWQVSGCGHNDVILALQQDLKRILTEAGPFELRSNLAKAFVQ